MKPASLRQYALAGILLALVAAPASARQSAPAGPKSPPAKKPTQGSQRIPSPPRDEGPEVRDPRAEQVLKDAIKAQGGAEALTARQTIYTRSRIKNFAYPDTQAGTITVWFKRPMKIRQEVTYPNKKEIRVFDGERALVDAGQGPKLMGPLMALMMQRGILEIDSPILYNHGTLSYLSIAKDQEGRVTQKLSWHYQGYARDIMVDMATSRVNAVGEFDTPAGAISRLRIFEDYRPVQGVFMPYHQEVFRNNQKYSEVDLLDAKFNLPVEDSLFEYTGPDSSTQDPEPTSPAEPRRD